MGPAEVRQFYPLDDTGALMRTAMSISRRLIRL
jgi:hypothetical protein